MPKEYEIVIADASCFILLGNIDELDLLKKLFGKVTTTSTVALEFGEPLPDWVQIRALKSLHNQETLELEIDAGEASAIALSLESEPSLLVLDDHKARKVADRLKLNYTGTLGIILKAKQSGIINSIQPLLEKVQNTNFRFSVTVYKEILLIAGES